MPKLSDLSIYGPKRIIMKGKPRTGKTAAAGSYPEPILHLDLDNRWETLKKHFPNKDITVESFGINDFERFCRLTDQLEERCPYRTVIPDGLTSFCTMSLQYALDLKNRGGGKKEGKKFGVLEVNTIEDFNVETAAITALLGWMEILKSRHGVTTILTAHLNQVEVKPIDKTAYTIRELMTGGKKAAARLPGLVDEIYHFESFNDDLNKEYPIGYNVYTKRGGEDFADTLYPIPASFNWTGKNFYETLNGFPGMKELRDKDEEEYKRKQEQIGKRLL